ncbi:DUF3307 domain-containing protein [Halalkalibaculum sp. DA384]|uniref:DUF3307 domain-containing protein n=1 Tax=Halalkalibaculum sp. DA384 TaxID=3373606 RepID=UPI003754ECEA
MISQPEILILLRIITAHLLADFLLQPEHWIHKKNIRGVRAPQLYYHVGIVGVLTYLFLADWSNILLPLFITGTHFAIDWWKSGRPQRARYFILDQMAHLLMILTGWIFYIGITTEAIQFIESVFTSPPFWIILISYLAATWPFGYLIAIITRRWQRELASGDSQQLAGLQNAGMWIGWTERFIILTFILLEQYGAIGFLIAAKSIFRFSGKLDGNRERKEAEYILIGTLLSFALSIALGIGVAYLLEQWG